MSRWTCCKRNASGLWCSCTGGWKWIIFSFQLWTCKKEVTLQITISSHLNQFSGWKNNEWLHGGSFTYIQHFGGDINSNNQFFTLYSQISALFHLHTARPELRYHVIILFIYLIYLYFLITFTVLWYGHFRRWYFEMSWKKKIPFSNWCKQYITWSDCYVKTPTAATTTKNNIK